MQEEDQH